MTPLERMTARYWDAQRVIHLREPGNERLAFQTLEAMQHDDRFPTLRRLARQQFGLREVSGEQKSLWF